jgi:hypothetical protein
MARWAADEIQRHLTAGRLAGLEEPEQAAFPTDTDEGVWLEGSAWA